jgi:hypothetical protein
LREHEHGIAEKGARLAAIGLCHRAQAIPFRTENGVTFPLLVDEKRATYALAGLGAATMGHLFKKENHDAWRRARAAGFRQRGLGKDPFQLGGTFVLGPGDVDLFAHASSTFSDNAPIESVLAVLKR